MKTDSYEENTPHNSEDENRQLRREYRELRKTPHGEQAGSRHPDIQPEWVMHIVNEPYDRWDEVHPHTGEPMTILVGRIPQFNQWIKVVFEGSSVDSGRFVTAYADRQLAKQYGGRPWPSTG
jgi:hypothetical protein